MSIPNDVQSDVVGWVVPTETFQVAHPQTLLNMLLKPKNPYRFGEFAEASINSSAPPFSMHKQENHQVRDSEVFSRGEEDADVHSGSQRWREKDRDTERAARLLAEVLYERGQVDIDRQQHAAHAQRKKSIQRGVRNCFRRCARANLLSRSRRSPINPAEKHTSIIIVVIEQELFCFALRRPGHGSIPRQCWR